MILPRKLAIIMKLFQKTTYDKHGKKHQHCGAPGNFSATLSLLNLLEESLGRSKPATNLMQAQ
jgi:hypothetical protein